MGWRQNCHCHQGRQTNGEGERGLAGMSGAGEHSWIRVWSLLSEGREEGLSGVGVGWWYSKRGLGGVWNWTWSKEGRSWCWGMVGVNTRWLGVTSGDAGESHVVVEPCHPLNERAGCRSEILTHDLLNEWYVILLVRTIAVIGADILAHGCTA